MVNVAVQDKYVNGVNVSAVQAVAKDIQSDFELAKCTFRLHNKWINGSINSSNIDGFFGFKKDIAHPNPFSLEVDEPSCLAGSNKAPGPVEYLLHALVGCLTTTMVYHSAIRDIQIDEVDTEVEGDLDLRGFLGISNDVPKGYQNIRVNFKVKTDEQNLDRLKALSKLSPVFDVVSKGTDVQVSVERI